MDSQYCTKCAKKSILLLIKSILECDDFQSCCHDEPMHLFITLTEGILKHNDKNSKNASYSKERSEYSKLQPATGNMSTSHHIDSSFANSGSTSNVLFEALFCLVNQTDGETEYDNSFSASKTKPIETQQDSTDQSFTQTASYAKRSIKFFEDENETNMSTTFAGYPKRLRKSKYSDIDGDLSHLRRDPKRSKRKGKERKCMKKDTHFQMESSKMLESNDTSSVEDTEESEKVLIVKELRKYLCSFKSIEHQTLAICILRNDKNLMRVFLEENKK